MKIALLNLPVDNNYGGNLQRYALMKVLQDMGHDVTHINFRVSYSPSRLRQLVRYSKRMVSWIMGKPVDFFYEKHMRVIQQEGERYINEFYEKYIRHTKIVYDISDIKHLNWDNYDVALVGSDQVWRYDMAQITIGIDNFFFKFLDDRIKKIAYSVSLGNYDESDIPLYQNLKDDYTRFSAVSFREEHALEYVSKIGWEKPEAEITLDPTLLLTPEDYIKNLKLSKHVSAFVFCYILDKNEMVQKIIKNILSECGTHERIVECGLKPNECVSIEEWLENIINSSIVITDSYHGVAFSILFNKKFFFLGNKRRGNARIDSLFRMLDLNYDNQGFVSDFETSNRKIIELREKSINFLRNAIDEL